MQTPHRLPAPGTESLSVTFPFMPLGAEEQRAALRALPRGHTCANTLELPDYLGALLALEKPPGGGSLAAARGRGAEGVGAWGSADTTAADAAPAPREAESAAAARRRARCKAVLAERLEYAVVHGSAAYALDDADE